MSYLAKLKRLESPPIAGNADPVDKILDGEGRIIAVEIASTVLGANIWLAFDDDFDPEDGKAVFYGHELSLLKNKTAAELREIHRVKLAFGAGSKVRQ